MSITDETRQPRRARNLVAALLTEWRELGGLGRIALGGIALSVVITLALGFSIPRSARRHLLDARTDILANVTNDLTARGLVPIGTDDPAVFAEFDEEVRLRLLGGETIRVKLWSPDGRIVYSDSETLMGRTFELSDVARRALDGDSSVQISDLSDPAHEFERDLGELIEFYLPVTDPDGAVFGLFEIEQRVDALNVHLGRIQRDVWLSIAIGLGILSVFMGSLTVANAHVLAQRRRQTEDLLGALLRAQDEERKRIVGALHDDIGQPMYRLLYGLQGSRAQLDGEHPVADELERLESLVRDLDGTLRAELKLLHSSVAEDLGLGPALGELADTTRQETHLDVALEVDIDLELDDVPRAALFRAAQEGLTNARKHAGADRVSIRVRDEGSRVVLEVEDDGRGPDGPDGLGIATTRERLEAIGGGLAVMAGKSATGTVFRAWVPVDPGSPN